MKLMVCGKGGSGKSLVTSLLARQYTSSGHRVVLLDADTSNTSLHRGLGVAVPPDLRDYLRALPGARETLQATRESGASVDAPLLGTWDFSSLTPECSSGTEGLRLLRLGKLEDAEATGHFPDGRNKGKGRWVMIARPFLAGLELGGEDRLLIDTDAGLEHLARGLGHACDRFLVVVDPSHESVLLARELTRYAERLGRPLHLVLNKTDPETSGVLRDSLADPDRILGEVPRDPALQAACLAGAELPPTHPAAAALLEALEAFAPSA